MVTSKTRGRTVEETLDGLISRLEKTSETPGLDAQVLLAQLMDRQRSWLLAHPESTLSGEQFKVLDSLVVRLEAGEPLPYILGTWEFFGLQFEVTPDVLIPRPETEMLIERGIAFLHDWQAVNLQTACPSVLDAGTGSGCIAIALAINVPEVVVTATDISPAALRVAHRNAERLGVTPRVKFIEADLFPNPFLPEPFSLILANLPYIPTTTLRSLPIFEREPSQALDGGFDGLILIRRLLTESPRHLASGGMMLLEIEASEGAAVRSLASAIFPNARIALHTDLSGQDRMLEVQV